MKKEVKINFVIRFVPDGHIIRSARGKVLNGI